ncbi:MAG: hypothetical protein MJK12_21510 [Colwellia sp.]|nr:hypothetical protein [Colwellia sp.]
MVTREEHSRNVKRKRLIIKAFSIAGLSIFLTLLVSNYLDSQNDDIEIVDQWYECKINFCEYRVTVKNNTKLRKSAFVRITAYYRMVHPDGGDTFPVVNSERIEVNLEQNNEHQLTGEIKVPLKASFLKFHSGSV